MFCFAFTACEKDESESEPEVVVNETSIIPATYEGRENISLGCIEINSRTAKIEVWDHGTVDGDVVSIIANGQKIIREQELNGPDNPTVVDYEFGNNGFNYLTLYAHNLGDIPPNTCTVAINDVEFVLSANLNTNGSVNVVVSGYGVDCSNAGSGGGGGDNGGGNSSTGDIIFWTNQDFGCGYIDVNVNGVGSTTLSGYYSTRTPNCSDTGAGGVFNDLQPGNYSYSASCSDYSWSGDFTIDAGGCLTFQLRI